MTCRPLSTLVDTLSDKCAAVLGQHIPQGGRVHDRERVGGLVGIPQSVEPRGDQSVCAEPDFSASVDQPMCAQPDKSGLSVMFPAQWSIAIRRIIRFHARRLIFCE